ncbi:MAG: FecR domain-containing protein [Sideroxydans sp.]|jgi:hypothetical protein
MKVVALLFCLLFSQISYAEDVADHSSDFVYQVQSGDTLSKLATSLLDSPKRWQEVAAYNQLPDANRIEPGQKLRIQQPWLKSKAGKLKVEAVSGLATADGNEIMVGDEIAVGAELATSAGGALRLRLPDGSLVNMMEGAQLQVEKLEQRQGSMFVALFRLVTGQVEAFKKKYPDGQADLAIRTKTATLGVKGTHFRMRQEGDRAYAEIEQGLVSYDAQKTPMMLALAGGQGSVADGEHAAEVVDLLPPPSFPLLPTEFDTPYIQWMMPELEGATGFLGELARDEEFSNHLVSVRAKKRKIILTDLPNGRYWLRLRAVDRHGLQGREAKVSFAVNVPPRKFAMTKVYVTGNGVQLRWVGRKEGGGYQVQIADNLQFNKPMLDVKTSDNSVEIARPKPGQYFMRVRQIFNGGVTDSWDVPMVFEAPR